jgi:hypothetical protein
MSTNPSEIIEKKVQIALKKIAKRMADLRFFEQVLWRAKGDEDLSNEIVGWNNVTKKERLETIKQLIHKCKADLANGYWETKNNSIKTKVQSLIHPYSLVPNYKVEYIINTEHGDIVTLIDTNNANYKIEFDLKKCKNLSRQDAERYLSKALLIDMIGI